MRNYSRLVEKLTKTQEQIKKQPTKIYFVVGVVDLDHITDTRTFGWYFTFEEAEKGVSTGITFECRYQYALIEEFEPGIHAIGKVIQWYKWNNHTNLEECKYEPIDEPEHILVNFAMG